MSPQKAGRENKRLRLCRAGVTAAVAGCTNKANGPAEGFGRSHKQSQWPGGGPPVASNKPNRPWPAVQTKPIAPRREHSAAVGRNENQLSADCRAPLAMTCFTDWRRLSKKGQKGNGRDNDQRQASFLYTFSCLPSSGICENLRNLRIL